MADDAIDRTAAPRRRLRSLHERLDRIYRGMPVDHPADRAFAAVVERHLIPRALPEALLEGFAWDLNARRYDTIEDLHGYAARVAGCVGVMMTLVMGRRDPAILARACDLGIAMQFTNIARDVGEDARAGRLYLPQQWLREVNIGPNAFLARPAFSKRVGWRHSTPPRSRRRALCARGARHRGIARRLPPGHPCRQSALC